MGPVDTDAASFRPLNIILTKYFSGQAQTQVSTRADKENWSSAFFSVMLPLIGTVAIISKISEPLSETSLTFYHCVVLRKFN